MNPASQRRGDSEPPEQPTLRLFQPKQQATLPLADPSQHRLVEPVLETPNPPPLAESPPPAESASDAYAAWNAKALASLKYRPKLVPAELRPQYAATTSVPQFYRDCCSGRWEAVRKDVQASTNQKDRQVLNRWAWGTKPEGWPASHPWEGPSLAVIEASNHVLIDEFIQRLETGSVEDPDEPYSPSTIHTTWGPLRTIIKHAVSMQAIGRFPEPSGMPEKEVEARPYKDAEIERLWPLLSGQPLQRVALVLSVNAGPRPLDLFTLRRDALVQDALGRWTLKFQARKTGKKHLLPLADVTVRALRFAISFADRQTLPGMPSDYFFPGLSDPSAKEPEDSAAARRRANITRVIWDAAGLIEVERPWQSGRSTCGTRLAALNRDAGKFMLGTSSPDVFTTHYAPARPDVWEAVLAVPQPACFLREFAS